MSLRTEVRANIARVVGTAQTVIHQAPAADQSANGAASHTDAAHSTDKEVRMVQAPFQSLGMRKPEEHHSEKAAEHTS